MSLKKRMFRSNMTILFAALFSLMLIILGVLVVFEDTLEDQLYAISGTRIEEHAGEVLKVVEQAIAGWNSGEADGEVNDIESIVDQVQAEVQQWDYYTAVIADRNIMEGYMGEHMQDVAGFFGKSVDDSGQTGICSFQKATIVGKHLGEEKAYLVAVHFPEENWIASSLNSSFYAFVITALLAGFGAIIILMILAAFITRKMNRMVMEPVELLVAGAERIKSGNMNEKIDYHGETEFEHVCQTFNDMQQTILDDQEQKAKTEQARTDMVTGISHDLRTPLTSIQGYIKGVLDGVADTDEKKRMYLQTAYESTKEMNVLLTKLFDFSRMESGQMPFHMVKADLGEYTAAYVAQKEMTADPDKLEFHMQMERPYFTEISLDIEQVRRIFDNLLENSIKYGGVMPVQIDISIKETEDEVIFAWKDNGKGVPQEKLERVFERFYRCDEARQMKGSGVGLYVVKYIMEKHNGSVRAENEGGLKIMLHFPKTGNCTESI